jgi:tRNA threonylcarbamoyladenosine biosynthesis protein TsaB
VSGPRSLALELSSPAASLALFDGERCVAHRAWREERRGNRPVFAALDAALAEAGWPAAGLDRFLVGRGPGIYSGMRVALMLARALALPRGLPVFAVASGAALAAALAETEPEERVAIVGDARRGQCWVGRFRRAPGGVEPDGDWTLVAPDALATALPPGTVAATPEWERLRPAAAAAAAPGVRWLAGDRYPDAGWVGRLAFARLARGEPSEPLAPLYLHPAVAGAARP